MRAILEILLGITYVAITPVITGTYYKEIEPVLIVEDTRAVKIEERSEESNTNIVSGMKALASNKLDDLVKTGYWSHTNSNGCDFRCRASRYVNGYSWIGENLYRGKCSTENAYRLWEKSPEHKEILEHDSEYQILMQRSYTEDSCYIILIKAIKL